MKVYSIVLAVPLVMSATASCSSSPGQDESADTTSEALSPNLGGGILFALPFPGGNGRACTTCHAERDHFALLPSRVASSYPNDPIFRKIDADDPNAAKPTYDHLRAGLVRIPLPMAANIDEIDENGSVITNAARTIEVWRGVPSIENTALTAPYQYDGRAPTYQEQAAGAFLLHQQIQQPIAPGILDRIATFEGKIFSSPAIEKVSDQIDHGKNPADPTLSMKFPPGSDEAAGQAIFIQGCTLCHGGPRGNTVTSQAAHDQTFFATNPDGTPVFGPQGPVLSGTHQNDRFMNLGTAGVSYLTQPATGPITSGLPPVFQAVSYVDQFTDLNTLPLPHHRLRFYTDASRTTKVVDLPPSPTLGLGPTFLVQQYSVDPGACVITGDPADYEAFDVPQLHGLANTAPYFHDGSMKTLEDVVEFYSSRVFAFVSAANFPPIYPSLSAGGAPESLSPTQKKQLVAFLKHL